MPITHDFSYFKPENIKEALGLLTKYNRQAKVLAGGTDLICWLKEDLIQPEAIIDIKAISTLNKIAIKNDVLEIGALVTLNDILDSPLIKQHFPLLQEMAKQFASMGVRNRATIAGNICSAVPSCDSAPVLLVGDASVVVRHAASNREKIIPLIKWFLGPRKTQLQNNELVTKILLPVPQEKSAGCYLKLGRYQGEDLAQGSVAILVCANTFKVAFGAVAPTPLRAYAIEAELDKCGGDFAVITSDAFITKLQAMVPSIIKPIDDIRASKEYRMHMIKIMLERGLKKTIINIKNNG